MLSSSEAPSPALLGSCISATALAHLSDLDEGGPPHILRELVELFTESIPQLLSQARGAIDDPVRLTMIAHSMKGSCSNFGADRMEALCFQLEQLTRQPETDGPRGMIEAIEGEYFKVRAALENALQQIESAQTSGSAI